MDPQQPTNYDFIMNPGEQPASPRGPQSIAQRIAIIGGALVILLFVGVFVSNLIKGSDATKPALISLIKEQRVLSSITEKSLEEQSISEANSNAAITIQLTMASQRQGLLTYANQNNITIDAKEVLVSTAKIDANLTAAVSGGTYNTALQTALKTELESYKAHLKRAFSEIKGSRGREIIQQDFDATELLLQQLTATR